MCWPICCAIASGWCRRPSSSTRSGVTGSSPSRRCPAGSSPHAVPWATPAEISGSSGPSTAVATGSWPMRSRTPVCRPAARQRRRSRPGRQGHDDIGAPGTPGGRRYPGGHRGGDPDQRRSRVGKDAAAPSGGRDRAGPGAGRRATVWPAGGRRSARRTGRGSPAGRTDRRSFRSGLSSPLPPVATRRPAGPCRAAQRESRLG